MASESTPAMSIPLPLSIPASLPQTTTADFADPPSESVLDTTPIAAATTITPIAAATSTTPSTELPAQPSIESGTLTTADSGSAIFSTTPAASSDPGQSTESIESIISSTTITDAIRPSSTTLPAAASQSTSSVTTTSSTIPSSTPSGTSAPLTLPSFVASNTANSIQNSGPQQPTTTPPGTTPTDSQQTTSQINTNNDLPLPTKLTISLAVPLGLIILLILAVLLLRRRRRRTTRAIREQQEKEAFLERVRAELSSRESPFELGVGGVDRKTEGGASRGGYSKVLLEVPGRVIHEIGSGTTVVELGGSEG